MNNDRNFIWKVYSTVDAYATWDNLSFAFYFPEENATFNIPPELCTIKKKKSHGGVPFSKSNIIIPANPGTDYPYVMDYSGTIWRHRDQKKDNPDLVEDLNRKIQRAQQLLQQAPQQPSQQPPQGQPPIDNTSGESSTSSEDEAVQGLEQLRLGPN